MWFARLVRLRRCSSEEVALGSLMKHSKRPLVLRSRLRRVSRLPALKWKFDGLGRLTVTVQVLLVLRQLSGVVGVG